jgi:hypothetical protein
VVGFVKWLDVSLFVSLIGETPHDERSRNLDNRELAGNTPSLHPVAVSADGDAEDARDLALGAAFAEPAQQCGEIGFSGHLTMGYYASGVMIANGNFHYLQRAGGVVDSGRMSARCFHKEASEYHERDRQTRAERIGKVVRFLREHPLSTSDEVYAATGVGVMDATKYCINVVYNGNRVWRLNHRKLKAEGLE